MLKPRYSPYQFIGPNGDGSMFEGTQGKSECDAMRLKSLNVIKSVPIASTRFNITLGRESEKEEH